VKRPKWLTQPAVLAIHEIVLSESGGMPGLRDAGLLESALARPRNLLLHDDKASLFDLAATLCFGLVKNHAFLDGNKRTALVSTHAFLWLNRYAFLPPEAEAVQMMIGIAEDAADPVVLSRWLAEYSAKRRQS
jgi:death-on-curing protein